MKKLAKSMLMLLVGVLMFPAMAMAQQMPIPVDTTVRIGKLPNGLTYYIRHNEYPKGQAEFFIAQKVGSILEEDNQRGLAHFLEHMCFNGTKNFPGNQVVSWLETKGVKFGQNLNAYTSVDETVYNISNVPTADVAVQDSCLLILHDWACNLLLEDAEIDKEREVIHQEWRRSMVGQMRILEKLLPVMYPGNRYGERLPIGTIDVIDNFPYKALRDYYHTWYRPDQQGIIVVGDIDVDRIEAKIKEMFSHIEMPADAKERIYYPVEDTPGTIYAIGQDKEQSSTQVQLMFKRDAMPKEMKGDITYMMMEYVSHMITSMLNTRLEDMSSKPDAPFAAAGASDGEFFLASTKDAFSVSGVAKTNDIKPVVEAIYREVLRAQRGGFTATEYARARAEYISRLEKAYKNRASRESGSYAREYASHFTSNEPIPGIEWEYQTMNMVVNQIPVEGINQIFAQYIKPDNRVLLALFPEKDGVALPTEAELAQVIAAVDAETIEAYVDNVKSEPLIANLPVAGKVVKETQNATWGTTEWTLSNGAKVIIKPTKFKEDEILMTAVAKGGTSTVGDEFANELILMPQIIGQYGLGDYTNADLQKYLAGKQVSLRPSFSEYTRQILGNTTPKDLNSLMELTYMMFTAYNITADEYAAIQNMFAGVLQNQEATPDFQFNKNLAKALYSNPRNQMLSVDIIKSANREKMLGIAKQMTANAADYTFVFVGNVDAETLKPLVEQYIASIPGDAKKATKKVEINKSLEIGRGTKTDEFTYKMETPQTTAAIISFGEMEYTDKNQTLASMAGQILSARLISTIREKEGAVYSIWAQGSMSRIANEPITIQSVFPMKPELKEKVLGMIKNEFVDMESNINEEEFNKVKEFMIKSAIEAKEKNGSWLSGLVGVQLNGVDTFNGLVETIKSITVDDVEKFMKDFNKQGNYRVVIQDPAE